MNYPPLQDETTPAGEPTKDTLNKVSLRKLSSKALQFWRMERKRDQREQGHSLVLKQDQ